MTIAPSTGSTTDLAIIQTVDYFTPIVDDPYDYGAIAVANALSDVYAMGAKPLFALNVVGFHTPRHAAGDPDSNDERRRRQGHARPGCRSSAAIRSTTRNPNTGSRSPGVIDPADIVHNSTAQVGDVLFLTKPLGVGILTTGIKRGTVQSAAIARAVEVMSTLNRDASEAMVEVGVNACTDVTGYGLLGHLGEMTREAASAPGCMPARCRSCRQPAT